MTLYGSREHVAEWSVGRIMQIDTSQPFQDALDAARLMEADDWIVLRRWHHFPDHSFSDGGNFYALRPDEIINVWLNLEGGDTPELSIDDFLVLHEDYESPPLSRLQPAPYTPDLLQHPAQARVLELAGTGAFVSAARVGTHLNADFSNTTFTEGFLAYTRPPLTASGGPAGAKPGASAADAALEEQLDVIFSTAAPEQIQLGRTATIDVRIELESEAQPLDLSAAGIVAANQDIVVILRTHGASLEVLGSASFAVSPPGKGAPRLITFGVRGVRPGFTSFEVAFYQENAEIETMGFTIEVLERVEASVQIRHSNHPRTVESIDDRTLTIAVLEPTKKMPNCFGYQVTSTAIGWNAREFSSPDFTKDHDTFVEEVKRHYLALESVFAPTATDLKDSLDRLAGAGKKLGQMLLSDELNRALWEHRHQIGSIKLRSFEPYIPWELIKLRDPNNPGSKLDERFLGEYNLVRHFSGASSAKSFSSDSWNYVIGDYQNLPELDPVGEERSFFTGELTDRLAKAPEIVASDTTSIKSMFSGGLANIIHMACHGEADLEEIEKSRLIVGVSPKVGGFEPLKLEIDDVSTSLNLDSSRPIVFLNACQTGRLGLTTVGSTGWPRVFWDAGAGAVIGTLWKVRSKAARMFAIEFYRAMLAGETLATATGRARQAARANGDVSWMAYVVYGDPSARMI